jgi:hypothetical protein
MAIVRTARADAGHEAVDLNTRELYTRNIGASRYSHAVEIPQTVATKCVSPSEPRVRGQDDQHSGDTRGALHHLLSSARPNLLLPGAEVKRFGHLFQPDRAVPPVSGVLTPRLDRRITAAVFDALGLKRESA